MGLGNTLEALPIENGGTGQSTRGNALSSIAMLGAASGDLDDYTTPGYYFINPTEATNAPSGINNWGTLIVTRVAQDAGSTYALRVLQIYITDDNLRIFIRSYTGASGWTNWNTTFTSAVGSTSNTVPIAQGGTSATTARAALANLYATNAWVGDDFNSVTDTGCYIVNDLSTIANHPVVPGYSAYQWGFLLVWNPMAQYAIQLYIPNSVDSHVYFRSYGWNAGWREWGILVNGRTTAALSEIAAATSLLLNSTVSTMNLMMTDTQAASMKSFWDTWSDKSVEYKQGRIVKDNDGELYRCNQTHTSSPEYNLTVASLWTHIEIAADGVLIWHPSTGAHDTWNTTDECHYPTGDDPIYISRINGNITIPGSDDRYWKIKEEEVREGFEGSLDITDTDPGMSDISTL